MIYDVGNKPFLVNGTPMFCFTMLELDRVIKKLKRNKSPGPDQVIKEVIKELEWDNPGKKKLI